MVYEPGDIMTSAKVSMAGRISPLAHLSADAVRAAAGMAPKAEQAVARNVGNVRINPLARVQAPQLELLREAPTMPPKTSSFLKRAQAYGAHMATVAFRKHAEATLTSEKDRATALYDSRAAARLRKKLFKTHPDDHYTYAPSPDQPFRKEHYGVDKWVADQLSKHDKKADAALGDPNFWQGGTDAVNAAQQAPPQPATAEEAIGLLPGGTFQGLNIRVTPDGQRSTTVKATPDVMQDPSGIQAIFAAEPGAKVELANPETAVPGTQVPTADNGEGAPPGSPGQQTAPVSTIPEAAGGAGDPGIGKVAALIRAGHAQALEKMASVSTEQRLRKLGPAIGATAGLLSAALSHQPKTFQHVLSRIGTGATIGWLPDIALSARDALR
jgi:hypothetical protein